MGGDCPTSGYNQEGRHREKHKKYKSNPSGEREGEIYRSVVRLWV